MGVLLGLLFFSMLFAFYTVSLFVQIFSVCIAMLHTLLFLVLIMIVCQIHAQVFYGDADFDDEAACTLGDLGVDLDAEDHLASVFFFACNLPWLSCCLRRKDSVVVNSWFLLFLCLIVLATIRGISRLWESGMQDLPPLHNVGIRCQNMYHHEVFSPNNELSPVCPQKCGFCGGSPAHRV